MVVNDDASGLDECGVLESIASRLAPTSLVLLWELACRVAAS